MDSDNFKYIILVLCFVIVLAITATIFMVSRRTKPRHEKSMKDETIEPVETNDTLIKPIKTNDNSTTKTIEPIEPVETIDELINEIKDETKDESITKTLIEPTKTETDDKPKDPNGVIGQTNIQKEVNCDLVSNMYYIRNQLIHLQSINKHGNIIDNGDEILRSCIVRLYDKLINILDSTNLDNFQEQQRDHNDRIEHETQLYCDLKNTLYVKQTSDEIEELYSGKVPPLNVIQTIFYNIMERIKTIKECNDIYQTLLTLTIRGS